MTSPMNVIKQNPYSVMVCLKICDCQPVVLIWEHRSVLKVCLTQNRRSADTLIWECLSSVQLITSLVTNVNYTNMVNLEICVLFLNLIDPFLSGVQSNQMLLNLFVVLVVVDVSILNNVLVGGFRFTCARVASQTHFYRAANRYPIVSTRMVISHSSNVRQTSETRRGDIGVHYT